MISDTQMRRLREILRNADIEADDARVVIDCKFTDQADELVRFLSALSLLDKPPA